MSKKKIQPIDDLRILDVRKPATNYLTVNDNLPSAPFFCLCIAPPGSGKGVMAVSWIYRFYRNVFDTIYWCSPTLKMDNTLALNIARDETIIKLDTAEDLENMDSVIKNIIETQQKAKDEDEDMEEVLIVLDDCISFINSRMILKLATMYRHLRISVLVSIQKMKMLSTSLRACASDVIVFQIPNLKQRTAFFEEFSIYPDIENYYEMATEKKYCYLRMDLRNMALYKGTPEGIEKIYQK